MAIERRLQHSLRQMSWELALLGLGIAQGEERVKKVQKYRHHKSVVECCIKQIDQAQWFRLATLHADQGIFPRPYYSTQELYVMADMDFESYLCYMEDWRQLCDRVMLQDWGFESWGELLGAPPAKDQKAIEMQLINPHKQHSPQPTPPDLIYDDPDDQRLFDVGVVETPRLERWRHLEVIRRHQARVAGAFLSPWQATVGPSIAGPRDNGSLTQQPITTHPSILPSPTET